jgi:flavodoxin
MKTAVCYFTGTGNSLFVAERLSENLKEARLFSMAELERKIPVADTGSSDWCSRCISMAFRTL